MNTTATDMARFPHDMKVWKSPLMPGAADFQYKDLIRGTIARFPERKEISIQMIESIYPGKGNCHHFVELFKQDVEARGWSLVSSTSLSPVWEDICTKLQVKIYD